jgi:hypothetical protein
MMGAGTSQHPSQWEVGFITKEKICFTSHSRLSENYTELHYALNTYIQHVAELSALHQKTFISVSTTYCMKACHSIEETATYHKEGK